MISKEGKKIRGKTNLNSTWKSDFTYYTDLRKHEVKEYPNYSYIDDKVNENYNFEEKWTLHLEKSEHLQTNSLIQTLPKRTGSSVSDVLETELGETTSQIMRKQSMEL